MRQIGHLEGEAAAAAAFGDYLYAQGIRNNIEHEQGRTYVVWVHDEEQLEQAKSLLDRFRQNPAAPEFQKARQIAKEQRAAEAADQEAAKRRRFDRNHLWPTVPVGTLTIILIVACAGVAFVSQMGEDKQSIMWMFITEYQVSRGYLHWLPGLPEITQKGEVWRLVTPVFIHFGIWHILMNMLWLKDLGSEIEYRKGPFTLILLVIFIGVVSNLSQYALRLPVLGGGTPNFGGMSGVIYGLMGYVWMKGKLDPRFGLTLHSSTVTMMLVWLVICFIPSLHIANNAHVAGLLSGMAWGIVSSAPWRRKPPPPSYY